MPPLSERNPPPSAFSLVEVVLVLGLVAFAVIALFGMLPSGLVSVQDGRRQEAATDLLTAAADDMRNTPDHSGTSPMLGLAARSDTPEEEILFFDEQGVEVSGPQDADFRLAATPRRSSDPTQIFWHLEVSWPPQAESPANTVETVILLRLP